MDYQTGSAKLKCSKISRNSSTQAHASKKRKGDQKIVVTVKIQGGEHEHPKKQQKKMEGPPSDCWSWRKYGQKPIKGSPHPSAGLTIDAAHQRAVQPKSIWKGAVRTPQC
ncbi:hypothetical protein ACH5RR_019953 [Cinchona calisaya]|uniref:WRKY domain-containing protein n=1 Tax=Cinchona calisaya TaxID=153742 RepID=A0ABD2ZD10_9GENT